jgi:hypothetical protein
MYNKLFLAGMFLLAATSCTNESELIVVENQSTTVPVRVHVSGFSVSMSEFSSGGTTRAAQDVVDYTDVKAIDLAFYEGSTEVYKHTQLRSDNTTYNTFGEFSCNLPVGNYTLVVIGRGYSNGDVFVLSSPISAAYTTERARETFCATQDVTITNAVPLDLSVTLNRIIARLTILSTDVHSASVTHIRTTYGAGGKSFNPTTGLATVNTGFAVTNSGFWEGDGTLHISNYTFLATDEQTMTVTLEALDADENVLSTKVIPNVPLKRNRVTTLSGQLFTTDASAASFKVETDWLEGNTVNY